MIKEKIKLHKKKKKKKGQAQKKKKSEDKHQRKKNFPTDPWFMSLEWEKDPYIKFLTLVGLICSLLLLLLLMFRIDLQ